MADLKEFQRKMEKTLDVLASDFAAVRAGRANAQVLDRITVEYYGQPSPINGALDILVNVAGVAPKVRADLLTMTEESYDYVMDINTKGTFFLTQLAATAMIQKESAQKGSIVNISSLSAYTSSVNRGEYCISKAGVSMITKLFADRLAQYGISVNEIRPGIIATDMTQTVQKKYDVLIEDGLLPIARWGRPEDVAAAVWAFCSDSLPYVTGQSLDVDGGFHLRRL